jgi:hypothetical protein
MPENKLSFIPQKKFEPALYKGRGLGFAIIISFLLFFISIGTYGGLWLYKNNLSGQTAVLADSLEKAKAAFDIPMINNLGQVSGKIDSSKKLLEQHISPLPILDTLAKDTLKTVRFKGFRYAASKAEGTVITMEGSANDYSSLALQGDVFEKDKNIKSVSFSGLGLGEKGVVNFGVKLTLDPSMIIFKGEEKGGAE